MTQVFKSIGQFVCHQIPERSLWTGGDYLPVCARCVGVYLGMYIGYSILLFRNKQAIGPPHLFVSLFLTSPLIVDGVGQFFGLWTSTNDLRLITGLFFGTAISPLLIYLLSLLPLTRKVQLVRSIVPSQIDLGKLDDPWIGYRAFAIGLCLAIALLIGVKAIVGSPHPVFYWILSSLTTLSIGIHIIILPIFVVSSLLRLSKS